MLNILEKGWWIPLPHSLSGESKKQAEETFQNGYKIFQLKTVLIYVFNVKGVTMFFPGKGLMQ